MNISKCRRALAPYGFIAPFVVTFAVFLAYPLIQSVLLALHQTSGPQHSRFVGLSNFKYLLSDPLFKRAMINTCIFAAGSLFIQLPCSLGLAMLLNRKDIRGRAFWRLILFSPSLVGLVFVAMIFALIFQKNTGLLNVWLHQITAGGFDLEFAWLETYIMPALILAALWMYAGFNMVYFLAALQNVDRGLIEAAMVDGAGPFKQFWHITLPAIRPIGTFIALLSLIGSFQLFELPWILLNGSGGPNNRGLTVVMYLYQKGFQQGDLGYASAIGWAMALVLLGFALIQRQIARHEEKLS